MLKVLFAGTPEVAVEPLQTLAQDDHFEVVAVLTRPDAPQSRGRKLKASPVKQAAIDLGIPVIELDPKDEDFIPTITSTGAQIAAVVAYGKILKKPVIEAIPMGWFNLHFSLLPQWRGAAPVQRSIWAGDEITGATVFRIGEGLDDGPTLGQCTVEISSHESAGELLRRLSHDGSGLLASCLQGYAQGVVQLVEQPQGSFEVANKITVEDAHIRFNAPAFAVDRQIRACTPNPGAWGYLHADASEDAQVFHVISAQVDEHYEQNVPQGSLIVSKKHVWVGTAQGVLELLEVKAAGKKAMKAADWARGARLAQNAYID
ncbi:MAG: methionyl-tRNA formyltransferase [Bifidobacteriaceae bacterium]|nr:methionyl-tRNA formyltransferase [Bifidobacteriaceae bacterium]